MSLSSFAALILALVLADNFLVVKLLGAPPVFGLGRERWAGIVTALATLGVTLLSGLCVWGLHVLLAPLALEWMLDAAYVLFAGAISLAASLLARLLLPSVRWTACAPLAGFNGAVLGAAALRPRLTTVFADAAVSALAAGAAFGLMLLLFSALWERLELTRRPACLRGLPLALLTAGLICLALQGLG